MADHLSDAADVVVTVASVHGCSALNHVKLMYFFSGCAGRDRIPYKHIPNMVVLVIGRHVF